MKTREQKIEKFKEITTGLVTSFYEKQKHLNPMLHILYASDDEEYDTQIKVFQLPGSVLSSGETKDLLAEIVIPGIVDTFKEKGKKVVCVCLVTEAWQWVKTIDKEQLEATRRMALHDIEKLKTGLEKKESLMFSFHTYEKSFGVVYLVERKGSNVTIGKANELESLDKGRFSKLLKPNPHAN